MTNRESLTPMMRQYMDIKENTNDALVFYRLGDFYELFFDDAIVASKALDLVLTKRSAGKNQTAPMCGVPHHAAKSYISKLVSQGFKVAIVEQVEDPKEAKGIVKREVVEIVTPGTFIEDEGNDTNEIASLHLDLVYATFVFCDIVEGKLESLRVMNDTLEIIKALEQRYIKELVVDSNISSPLLQTIQDQTRIHISYEEDVYEKIKHEDPSIEKALQKLLSYLNKTQKRTLTHLKQVVILNDESYLKMDYATNMNLELLSRKDTKDLSLFSFLNKTETSMGARFLKETLLRPLMSKEKILKRQEKVTYLLETLEIQDKVKTHLKNMYDLDRIIAKMVTQKHNAQDFVRLKLTLKEFENTQETLQDITAFEFIKEIEPLESLIDVLDLAIYDNAPIQFKDGQTFKPNIHKELDSLVAITKNGKQWLLEYEEKERNRTGIRNLRVGYTRAFGYYIEITKAQVENMRDDFGYIRRQTLTNAERYISEELQEFETKVLKASDRILEIEQSLFEKYTKFTLQYIAQIQKISNAIANLDVLVSFSILASNPNYSKPTFNNNNEIIILEGRHPVLEKELKSHQYIASDVFHQESSRLQILTGPNMGGKSTYMRMVALIVILAQMGSYVPAKKADLPLIDQIFTRMGASDDILMGQSTFMVEMLEAQTALVHASESSLILFDEIGRGTSTYDGMALAQAILEYILYSMKSNTIFSTHYHELTALEDIHEGVKNINVEVHEEDEKVTFLYRVIEGKADKSYGINVARLARLPQTVIHSAEKNLERLELTQQANPITQEVITVEIEPKGYERSKDLLSKIDPNQTTPMEALKILAEIKDLMKNE